MASNARESKVMNNDTLRIIVAMLGGIFVFFLVGLWWFGVYKIITDHEYTKKDVVIGIVVPPYPLWVGGKEFYKILTASSEPPMSAKWANVAVPGIITPPETIKAFDNCMRRYSPTPGPNLGFLAAQAACHTYIRAASDKEREAALCLAEKAKSADDPKVFDRHIKQCFSGASTGPIIAQFQCIMPTYLQVRSQADLSALLQKCG